MSRLALFVLITAAVGLHGCQRGGDARAAEQPGKSKGKDGKAGKPKGPPPALIKVTRVEAGGLIDVRVFLGQVQAVKAVQVAAPIAGAVAEVVPRAGDRVKAGDVLARLSTDLIEPQQAAARAAEAEVAAELAQARREHERAKRQPHPVVTVAEKERFEARVKALEGRLSAARATRRLRTAELDRHTITAPFDGVIRERLAEPGAWATAGTPLVHLVSDAQIEIIADVPPALLAGVQPGRKATLIGPGGEAPARVTGVVPALEAATRTLRVRLVPEGEARPPWLLAGMACDVRFEIPLSTEDHPGAVRVPRDALVRGPTGVRVMKVVEGAGVPVPVQVLVTANDQALVRLAPPLKPPRVESADKPLPPPPTLSVGDTLVTRGNERLRPGQPVKIAKDGGA